MDWVSFDQLMKSCVEQKWTVQDDTGLLLWQDEQDEGTIIIMVSFDIIIDWLQRKEICDPLWQKGDKVAGKVTIIISGENIT